LTTYLGIIAYGIAIGFLSAAGFRLGQPRLLPSPRRAPVDDMNEIAAADRLQQAAASLRRAGAPVGAARAEELRGMVTSAASDVRFRSSGNRRRSAAVNRIAPTVQPLVAALRATK
jgi:hypothetical protein